MKNYLESLGWYMYKSCHCGGTLSQSFKHPSKPGNEVKLKPNRGTWQYLVSKRVTMSGTVNDIQTKIN